MARIMGAYTREELAERAGVSVDFVDRLVDFRLLLPADGQFSDGDLRRTRFVRNLEQGGVTLETIGEAVEGGAISFGFFDAGYWERFGGLTGTTYRRLSTETGVSIELLSTLRESMGYARPGPDDAVREDELVVVPLLRTLIAMGANPLALERHMRIWGDSMRRVADADGSFYRSEIEEPLLAAGLGWSDMLRAASEATEAMVPLLDPALLSMYHAQSEHTWMGNIVEAMESALEDAGLHRSPENVPAMCFLDLSGYTRLTEERGDQAAAEMAATLAKLVQTGSHVRGGRPVKWLGDGVMVHFRQPGAAVLFALEMREVIPAADLPPPHAGIAAGPIVFQDGDYYGRTVNVAARVSARATAGQVLATDEVVRVTTDPDVEFVDMGPAELKGVSRPVRLHEARRRD